MVSARFYLLNSIEMEMEVTKDWLINSGPSREELLLQMSNCDSRTLERFRYSNERVPIEIRSSFFRVNGRPAVMGSTIKGIVRNKLEHAGSNRALVDELLGGEHGLDRWHSEHIESLFYFGNFVYSGNNEREDFKQIYVMNFRNVLYEAARKGARFRGSIYCKGIKRERLNSYVQRILEALNIRPGTSESYSEVFIGRYSNKGSKGRPVRIGFQDQQVQSSAIFGGVKFRVLRGCEV